MVDGKAKHSQPRANNEKKDRWQVVSLISGAKPFGNLIIKYFHDLVGEKKHVREPTFSG